MARLTLLSALLMYFPSLQSPPKQDKKIVKFLVAFRGFNRSVPRKSCQGYHSGIKGKKIGKNS